MVVENSIYMNEHTFNFIVVSLVQFVFFSVHYFFTKNTKPLATHLWKGVFIGLPIGLATDLLWGKQVGLFMYYLGFQPWFLILNSALSYGLWVANVSLFQDRNVKHIVVWSLLLGFVYEAANFLFPVWQWTFADTLTEYIVIILVASSAFTWLMMLALRIVYKTRFKFVPF